MTKILEMKQKRAALVKEARSLLEAAEKEKRGLSAEEDQQYDRIMNDVDQMGKDIEREERLQSLEDSLESRKEDPFRQDPEQHKGGQQRKNLRDTDEYRSAFERFIRFGTGDLSEKEFRAMQADDDSGGGYLIASQNFVKGLLKDVDNIVLIRQLATVYQLEQSRSLGVPTLTKDADDAEWTSELKTGSNTELEFGKRELRPHPLAKRALISNTLLRLASMGAESLVRERLAYKFAVAQEKAFFIGNGVNKPLGVFTASKDGISTSRDISTGNTATSIGSDGLIETKFALKGAYHPKAHWMFHRDAVKQIRKLKDANDQYIWTAGIAGGEPDKILDIPYLMSEYAPNTFTTGKYVGILGDFSFYWIADALDMQVQRLVELYAETNQTGFIGRAEVDGMPVLEEAFVRVKLA